MNTNYYAKTKRQYKYLIKRLNKLLQNGGWEKLSETKQNSFKKKLNFLFQKLEGTFSSPSLIKAMGTAALILGLSSGAMSQSFKASVKNPFGLAQNSNVSIPSLADVDGDGDLDYFNLKQDTIDYSVKVAFRENTGTKTAPAFGPVQLNPFGLTSDSVGYKSTLVDIDGDGDLDLFKGTYYGNVIYFKNTGTKIAPQFSSPSANPFNISHGSELALLGFGDLDDDGDMDLMIGSYDGDFYYYKNTGTKTAPSFAMGQKNPFGISNMGSYFSSPEFSDVDGDGDLDMMTGEEDGKFIYYNNTGSKTNPAFAAPVTNPFSLTTLPSGYSFCAFADLDGDGDDDILAGDYSGSYYGDQYYFENASSIGLDENSLSNTLNVFPNPTNGIVTVSLSDELGQSEIELTSTSGQLVLSKEIENTTNAKLDVSHLNSGVYILKLKADNRTGVKKLIIE